MLASELVDALRNARLSAETGGGLHPVWSVETADGASELIDLRANRDTEPVPATSFKFQARADGDRGRTCDLGEAVSAGDVVPSGRFAEFLLADDIVAGRPLRNPFPKRCAEVDRVRASMRERWNALQTPAVDSLLERWCGRQMQPLAYSRLCDAAFDTSTPWLEPSAFPITGLALARFEALADEARQLVDGRVRAPPYHKDTEIDVDHGHVEWGRWTLVRHARRVAQTSARFPVVSRLIDELAAAGTPVQNLAYLVLAPGAGLAYHSDGFAMFGSWHLGLSVPPMCALELGDRLEPADAGKCYAFEDAWIHRAWNGSDAPRVMLSGWCAHPTLSGIEKAALTHVATGLAWAI